MSLKNLVDIETAAYVAPNSPNPRYPGQTAIAVVNPDGSNIATDFSGTVTIRESTSNSVTDSVPASTAPQIILSANSNRKLFYIHNQSINAFLYIAFGEASSTTFFAVKVGPNMEFVADQPVYIGDIYGVWDIDENTNYALVTDMS